MRTTRITGEGVVVRRRHALAYLQAADIVADLMPDDDASANVVGSLAVLAGIAASDAICGRALGERSASDAHVEAVALLKRVEGATRLTSTLQRLLSEKSKAQYSPALLPAARAREMLTWARRLVEASDALSR